MPELPEVEAVCRRLRESAGSFKIVKALVLRASVAAPQSVDDVGSAASGRTITAVERKGKNILLQLGGGWTLRIHLRMTGNLYRVPDSRLLLSTVRAYFKMSDGTAIVFDDPRALGKIHVHRADEAAALLEGLGPEPREITADDLRAAMQKSRQAVKVFLMDQSKLSGLGNIYAAECLFRARVHPARPANSLTRAAVDKVHAAAVEVLRVGMDSAYEFYSKPGAFQEGETFPVQVYDREGEPCVRCRRKISRMAQGGRSTYYCPGCQR